MGAFFQNCAAGHLDAVGGRAVEAPGRGPSLPRKRADMEGFCPGDGEPASRFFRVGGDNRSIAIFVDCLPEVFYARGCDSVVIDDQKKGSHD